MISMNSVAYTSSSDAGSMDMQALKNHPLIREYASVDDDLYNLIKATNPMLKTFVDIAKEIVAAGGGEK
jgi:exo-beta-1,3-glucanase (GH17 family)